MNLTIFGHVFFFGFTNGTFVDEHNFGMSQSFIAVWMLGTIYYELLGYIWNEDLGEFYVVLMIVYGYSGAQVH